jgi:hypothetical protein
MLVSSLTRAFAGLCAQKYLRETFRPEAEPVGNGAVAPMFRVIPAEAYLGYFSSDRTHSDGTPPNYAPIKSEEHTQASVMEELVTFSSTTARLAEKSSSGEHSSTGCGGKVLLYPEMKNFVSSPVTETASNSASVSNSAHSRAVSIASDAASVNSDNSSRAVSQTPGERKTVSRRVKVDVGGESDLHVVVSVVHKDGSIANRTARSPLGSIHSPFYIILGEEAEEKTAQQKGGATPGAKFLFFQLKRVKQSKGGSGISEVGFAFLEYKSSLCKWKGMPHASSCPPEPRN